VGAVREGRGSRPFILAGAVVLGLASTAQAASAQGISSGGIGSTNGLLGPSGGGLFPGGLSTGGLLPQSSLFPTSLFPQSSLFPSTLLPGGGLFTGGLLPQTGLFPSSFFPQNSLFPSSLLPQSGLFPGSQQPTGSSFFSTSTLFPQNSLFPTLLQSNVFSTTLPGGLSPLSGLLPGSGLPLQGVLPGGSPSGSPPPLGGELVTLGGNFTGTASLPLGGSSGGGTTTVPVTGVFSSQAALPPGTVLASGAKGITITPANGVLDVVPPILQQNVFPVVGMLPQSSLFPFLPSDDLFRGDGLLSLRDLFGGRFRHDFGFDFGLGSLRDLGFSSELFHSGHHSSHHGDR